MSIRDAVRSLFCVAHSHVVHFIPKGTHRCSHHEIRALHSNYLHLCCLSSSFMSVHWKSLPGGCSADRGSACARSGVAARGGRCSHWTRTLRTALPAMKCQAWLCGIRNIWNVVLCSVQYETLLHEHHCICEHEQVVTWTECDFQSRKSSQLRHGMWWLIVVRW